MPASTLRETAVELKRAVQRLDERRPSLPGEHWAVTAAGLGALMLAWRGGGVVRKGFLSGAGIALLARGLSGRDGLLARLERDAEDRRLRDRS